MKALHLGALLLVLSGCATETVPPTAPGAETFAPGIYYATPGEGDSARLAHHGGSLPRLDFRGVGFDLSMDWLASVDDERTFRLTPHNGKATTIELTGLHHPGRPSLSADGSQAVVQAVDHERLEGGPGDNFDIYLADLKAGTTRRLSMDAVNDESPEWVSNTSQVVWSVFDPQKGIDAIVYDTSTHQVVRRLPAAGALHLDVSSDGQELLDAGRMRILRIDDGSVVADLRDEVLAALRANGFEPDDRFAGQAHRGTFPLDGAFSPDGQWIVFDGAVRKGTDYGVLVMRANRDGSGFEILTPLLPADPGRANNHNFSQLNPTWI